MIVLGLTGSIGMGKSTVSAMFVEGGVPVWDADQAVHDAYENNEAIYSTILRLFPEACVDARVNRKVLGEIVFKEPEKLRDLERAFGYLLEMDRARFLAHARWAQEETPLVVMDVPLLLENPNIIMQCHYVAVVHCPEEEQRRRVLARPGMTQERLDAVLLRQMPVEEKLSRADLQIDTAQPMLAVRQRVADIIENIEDEFWVIKQEVQ